MKKLLTTMLLLIFAVYVQNVYALTFTDENSGVFGPTIEVSPVELGNSDVTDSDTVNDALDGLANSCLIDGDTLYSGETRRFYRNQAGDCSDYINRTCNKAVLSGSSAYKYLNCSNASSDGGGVAAQLNDQINEQMHGRCEGKDGKIILYNGESAIFYKSDIGNCNEYQERACHDGKLTGSDEYKYKQCAEVQDIMMNKNGLDNDTLNKAGKGIDNVIDQSLRNQNDQMNKQLGDLWNKKPQASKGSASGGKSHGGRHHSSHKKTRVGFDAKAKVGGKSVSVHVAGSGSKEGVHTSASASAGDGKTGGKVSAGGAGVKASGNGHKTGVQVGTKASEKANSDKSAKADSSSSSSNKDESYISFGDTKVRIGNDVKIRVEGDAIKVGDKQINVTPEELKKRISKASNSMEVVDMELKADTNGTAHYEVKAKEIGKLFGLFSIDVEITILADVETGSVFDIQRPWYYFLVF